MNQDISSVQQFLDQEFRKPLGLPLKSVSSLERDTKDSAPLSKLSEQLQIILEEKVPLASFAMGDPVKYVNQIHSTGAKIMSMVTNIEDAISVAKNGSDIVMIQGSEAGGHRSVFNNRSLDDDYENIPLIGTMALVRQIVHALKKEIQDKSIPVVAAGGIADGRGLLAAVKEIVDTQQFQFNPLWNKSIDAKEKIRMIEERQNPRSVDPLLFIRHCVSIGSIRNCNSTRFLVCRESGA